MRCDTVFDWSWKLLTGNSLFLSLSVCLFVYLLILFILFMIVKDWVTRAHSLIEPTYSNLSLECCRRGFQSNTHRVDRQELAILQTRLPSSSSSSVWLGVNSSSLHHTTPHPLTRHPFTVKARADGRTKYARNSTLQGNPRNNPPPPLPYKAYWQRKRHKALDCESRRS